MKSGLLSILACPICKSYPLQLKIFKWETTISKFNELENIIAEKTIDQLKRDTNIKITKTKNKILVRDNIIRSEKKFSSYIEEVRKINHDILAIKDNTKTFSDKILILIKKELFNKIKENNIDKHNENLIKIFEQIEFYIYLLNWYLFYAEIEEGIMVCDKCNRWFPIIETIPQMLPDEVRNKKTEKEFLHKWKDLIEEKVLNLGKPFNLSQ